MKIIASHISNNNSKLFRSSFIAVTYNAAPGCKEIFYYNLEISVFGSKKNKK